MKKILYILLFFPLGLFGQTQIINVGTTANDGSGDKLRTAFQKVNLNTVSTQDSFAVYRALYGNIFTKSQTSDVINDTIEARITAAYDLSDLAMMKNDSNQYGGAITRTWFETYGGGGGGGTGGYEWLQFIVGTTTGAPEAESATFTVSDFAGDVIRMDIGKRTRDSLYINEGDTNTYYGYRYNSSGKITVRPALREGERVYIEAVPSVSVTKITLTGGASDLDGKLLAGWELNETSGTNAADVLSTYNGTYVNSPLLNQAGKFGVCPDFDGTDDYVNMGTNAALRLQTFSISFWVNTTFSGAYKGLVANHVARSAVHYGWSALMTETGKVEFTVNYSGSSNQIISTTSVNTGAWVNVICTFDGTNTNVYINNGASEDTDATAGTIIYHADNTFRIAEKSDVDYPFDGKIDCVYYFDEVITSGDRTTLQTQTYPF